MIYTEKKHDGYICQSTLLKRGWTMSMINNGPIEPVVITVNPHNPNWSPQKLYSKDMVFLWERSEWFHEKASLAAKRRRTRQQKKVEKATPPPKN